MSSKTGTSMAETMTTLPPEEHEPRLSPGQEAHLLKLFEEGRLTDHVDPLELALRDLQMVIIRRASLEPTDRRFTVSITAMGHDYVHRRLNPILHLMSRDGLKAEYPWPGQPPSKIHRPMMTTLQESRELSDEGPYLTRVYQLQRNVDNHFYYEEV